jgi:hypothetical protein
MQEKIREWRENFSPRGISTRAQRRASGDGRAEEALAMRCHRINSSLGAAIAARGRQRTAALRIAVALAHHAEKQAQRARQASSENKS